MNRPRKEIIPTETAVDNQIWHADGTRPATALEALMRCAPGQEPEESSEELQPFREAVADCLTTLEPQHRFVIEAVDSERLSQRQLAKRMGMSSSNANRLVAQARETVAKLLRSHPAIQERHPFMNPTNWEEAATDAVNYLHVVGSTTLPTPFDRSIENGKWILQMSGLDAGEELTPTLIGMGATALMELRTLGVKSDDVVDLLVERHHKYGPGNILEFRELGLLVRMSDKNARIQNSDRDFADETFVDALMDIVGYAAIAYMLDLNLFQLPFKETTS